MNIVFPSPKRAWHGCNKVPDRQAVCRPDDYLIGHRRRTGSPSSTYCTNVTFLLNFHLNHNKALLDGSSLLSSEQQGGVCRFWALTASSPMRGCERPPAERHNRCRGRRCCDARPSLHIGIIIAYIPTISTQNVRPWNFGTGNNYSQICRAATERKTRLWFVILGQTIHKKYFCFKNSNILIPSVEVACGVELGRRERWQAKLKDFPHWL